MKHDGFAMDDMDEILLRVLDSTYLRPGSDADRFMSRT